MIGVLPSPLRWKGWIAFPHTDATIPCIHDLNAKQKTVTLVHGEERGGGRSLPFMLLASATGRCDVVVSYAFDNDGSAVLSSARQRVTSVNPPLLPDYDRDGRIDGADADAYLGGREFRYWTNEDTAKGDYLGQDTDETPNAADLFVNGRLDLVNLFPLILDLKPFIDAWGSEATFALWAPGNSLRFCGADMSVDDVWEHQTNDVYTTTWSGWNIEEDLLGVNKISVAEALRMTPEDFKTNTVFYCYPSSMNSTNISLLVRAAHLTQGIPALARPTGGRDLHDVLDWRDYFNVNLSEDRREIMGLERFLLETVLRNFHTNFCAFLMFWVFSF